ncbi:hypothetical protein FRB99_006889 [Tulasnella sp. 403]|nr:hypothetical protein FRB99_006889 [Tulasnella sp. 403]
MAVAWIQFHDQRRPPPIDVDLQISVHDSDDDERDPYSLHDRDDDDEEIDEDKPLYSPLEKDTLSRHSSVGNSWGVTTVGRGFDWKWKKDPPSEEEGEDAPKPVHIPTVTQDESQPPSVNKPAPTGLASTLFTTSSPTLITRNESNRADTTLQDTLNPSEDQSGANRVSSPSIPSSFPPFDMTQQTSPFTPSLSPSPASPYVPLTGTISNQPSPRPALAARSQSMYTLPSPGICPPEEQRAEPSRSNNTSPSLQAQRARAWSRPVSPARSPSVPRLAMSPSAPSLNNGKFIVPMTPLIVTGGALTTPNTPRSPRLNRSRALQKRVSLIAGRQVEGLNLLGTEVDDADPDGSQHWVMFGSRRSSPVEDSEPRSASPDEYFDKSEEPGDFVPGPPVRRASHSRSVDRPNTPPPPEEDWHIGRAGQIKSLGRFNSSLFDPASPPTPLRCASFIESAPPSIVKPEDQPSVEISRLDSSTSLLNLADANPDDVHIPVEDEAPAYPPLDIPHPDWSLHRLSSSWSLSSHQRQQSNLSVNRRDATRSPARSVSTDRQDAITLMMKRMKSSQSIKRMSSESRRGGFLGGRTIDDYVILGEAGRGAYGLVKRARERKRPVMGLNEAGEEVIVEDVKPDETVGPPLIIKQIIKSRILADCWKKHPIHGTIPIEIYVMSAVSGTSYVLPRPRAWDPRRFEEDEDTIMMVNKSDASSRTVTPGQHTPNHTDVKIQVTTMSPMKPEHDTVQNGVAHDEDEELTELDLWRWREGELIKGHPNICPLEDFFEDASFYYLVLPATKPSFPKMPKGMEDAVDIGDRRPPSDLFDLGQIADALAFLHARGICHRDIKDENVVLGENGRCWLIDFGSSGVIRKNGWDTFSGTLDYAAPEILLGARYAGPPQDVWAFGIVAYVLLVGECPFASSAESAQGLEDPEGKPALALRARCSSGPAGFDEGLERDGGGRLGDAMELVRRCLDLDVARRPTMEQILGCRYVNGGQGWGQELLGTEGEEATNLVPA